MSDENDVIVRTGRGREVARVTIPGAKGRVAAVQVTYLPGDNTKLQDLTVQLAVIAPNEHEVEVVESQGIIGFAPNVQWVKADEDAEDDE